MRDDERESELRRSYDRVPYRSLPWQYAHPVRLATLAKLHEMSPADPGACRLLEIGCADGGNLIPLCSAYPGSEFVGVDISGAQVRAARARIEDAGIGNADVREMSLADIDDDFGEFDYIIAHGVLSWISEDMRSRLLAVCRERLAPQGIAFVSYNTSPGWHLRQMVREILLDRTRGIDGMENRVAEAERFLGLLAGEWVGRDDIFAGAIRAVRDQFADRSEERHYIAHEYLSADNHVFLFREFAELAERCGLAYLADANHSTTDVDSVPPEMAEEARSARGRIEVEQTLDHLRGRMFRQSLLRRDDCAAGEDPDLGWVGEMHITSSLAPISGRGDPNSAESVEYRDNRGGTVRVSHPLTKAALEFLERVHPVAVTWSQLVPVAIDRLGAADAEGGDPRILAAVLGSLWRNELVEYQAFPYPFAREVPACPRVSAFARLEALTGGNVTNARHERVALDEKTTRRVLSLLDGRRDRGALLSKLGSEFDSQRLQAELGRIARLALLQA